MHIWQGPRIPENQWALIVLTVEPSKATSNVYHAETGVLNTKVHKQGHFSQVITNLRFGVDECCGSRYFKGLIDEVIIYMIMRWIPRRFGNTDQGMYPLSV